jgi:hypothetical protein
VDTRLWSRSALGAPKVISGPHKLAMILWVENFRMGCQKIPPRWTRIFFPCFVYLYHDHHGYILTPVHERHGDPYLYPRSLSPHQYDLP